MQGYIITSIPIGIYNYVQSFIGSNVDEYMEEYLFQVAEEISSDKFPLPEVLDLYENTFYEVERTACQVYVYPYVYRAIHVATELYNMPDIHLVEAILFYHTFELELQLEEEIS